MMEKEKDSTLFAVWGVGFMLSLGMAVDLIPRMVENPGVVDGVRAILYGFMSWFGVGAQLVQLAFEVVK